MRVRLSIKPIFIGLLVLAVLAICVAMGGCIQSAYNHVIIPPDRFVFIEHHVHESGSVIEGDAPYGPCIDFPLYYYYNDKRSLDCDRSSGLENNISYIAVLGEGMSLSGGAGMGASTWPLGVSDTPFQSPRGVKILRFDADGTCAIEYKGQNITLKPGESWSNETSEIRERPSYSNTTRVVRANITSNDTITNYGVISKSNVTFGDFV